MRAKTGEFEKTVCRDKCSIPDCPWEERDHDWGAYVGGKYYCPRHTKEFKLVRDMWVRVTE